MENAMDICMLQVIGNTAPGVGSNAIQSFKKYFSFTLFKNASILCSFPENLHIHYFGV